MGGVPGFGGTGAAGAWTSGAVGEAGATGAGGALMTGGTRFGAGVNLGRTPKGVKLGALPAVFGTGRGGTAPGRFVVGVAAFGGTTAGGVLLNSMCGSSWSSSILLLFIVGF